MAKLATLSDIKTKPKGPLFLAAVIISVTSGQFVLLFYIPALPLIGHDLHVHGAVVEQTVTFFLYGFGISQLIYGNLSDSFGRKKMLLAGIAILAFGVILTYFTQTANMLLVSRLIQGLGAGAIAIIPRTIMKDSYEGSKFIKAVTIFMLVLTLTPAIAPLVGGAFVTYFSWRAMFLFLFFYIIIVSLVVIFLIPETLDKQNRKRFNGKLIFTSYLHLLKDKKYVIFLLSVMLSYAGMVLYMTFTAFIYEDVFSISPGQYGVVMIIPSLFLALGCSSPIWLPILIRRTLSINTNMILGCIIMIIGAISLMLICVFGFKTEWVVTIFISVLAVGIGFLMTNATTGMLNECSEAVGAGAALSGFAQMMGNGVILNILSRFHMYSTFYIGVWNCVFGVLILAMVIYLIRLQSRSSCCENIS